MALALAPTAVAHNQWNATTEFRSSPSQENPSRDHHGNLGVWNYMTGTIAATRDPATYAVMPNFTAEANRQVRRPATSDGFDTPTTWLNTTANAFEMHPSGVRYAITGWKSPLSGSVTISGFFTDADGAAGTASTGSSTGVGKPHVGVVRERRVPAVLDDYDRRGR